MFRDCAREVREAIGGKTLDAAHALQKVWAEALPCQEYFARQECEFDFVQGGLQHNDGCP